MSKADGIISTTLRLDTNTPEGWKAYAFLHTSRKEKKCRSYSELITDLLCACYDREMQKQRDRYLETREKEDAFVNWVKETITDAIRDAGVQGILNFVQLIQKSGTMNPAIDPVPAASALRYPFSCQTAPYTASPFRSCTDRLSDGRQTASTRSPSHS